MSVLSNTVYYACDLQSHTTENSDRHQKCSPILTKMLLLPEHTLPHILYIISDHVIQQQIEKKKTTEIIPAIIS